MEIAYWVIALLSGATVGIGLAYLILAAILNNSNNLGDSRLDKKEFSSEIDYVNKLDRMPSSQFATYMETNLRYLVTSKEYTDHMQQSMRGDLEAPVERTNV